MAAILLLQIYATVAVDVGLVKLLGGAQVVLATFHVLPLCTLDRILLKKIHQIRSVASIPSAIASIKPSPPVTPKLSEAIAGLGHSSSIPHPAPNNNDPMTN